MANDFNPNTVYWVWLQSALGIGRDCRKIIRKCGSARAVYDMGDEGRIKSKVFTNAQLERFREVDIKDCDDVLSVCRNNGWGIICYEDESYPEIFREIECPPEVLYYDGDFSCINNTLVLAIVGSRGASDYGAKTAELFGRAVAEADGIVVSGGAYGIDVHAHNGALSAGGKTIVVMGNGLGECYPQKNEYMRAKARENGALITEMPPYMHAIAALFPLRNRLISALSKAVLVVEANEKSGSLSTVNHALKQNVDVFVVPCSILDPKFSGTNKLIRDGAMVATCPYDFIAPYAEEYNIDTEKIKTIPELLDEMKCTGRQLKGQYSFGQTAATRSARIKRDEAVSALTGNELKVASALGDEFMTVDEIVETTKLPAHVVSGVLVGLEIQHIVISSNGNRYKLK